MSSDFYKFEIHSKLKKLIKYLQVLKSRHYSNDTPVILASHLQKVLYIVKENIDSVHYVHLPILNYFLETNFLRLCSFIEKASPAYVPWSLISELEEHTSTLIAPAEKVIIRAENYFNYSIHIVDIISELLSELRKYIGDIEGLRDENYLKPRIFTIPLLEKNNILLHSILFHEIGHFYEKKFSDSDDIKILINNTIADVIREGESQTLFTAGEATNILKGFIREIYSDIFALYYCGLPILFSTYHFQKAYPEPSLPDESNNYYPPIKYRLRILYNICISEKINNELKKSDHNAHKSLLSAIRNIKDVLSDENDIDLLNSKDYSLIARISFENIIEKIVKDAKSVIVTSLNDLEDIDKLFDKLLNMIPPCEINEKPQNIMKILTSGWAVYYYYFNESSDANIRYENITTLNLLCLKALTQSFFFRKFIKTKNGHNN